MPDKLKNFLSELAVDPKKLSGYLEDPDAAMKAAGLDQEESAALKSGDSARVYASLSGQPQAQPAGAPILGIIYAAQPPAGGANVVPLFIIYVVQPPAAPSPHIIWGANPAAQTIWASNAGPAANPAFIIWSHSPAAHTIWAQNAGAQTIWAPNAAAAPQPAANPAYIIWAQNAGAQTIWASNAAPAPQPAASPAFIIWSPSPAPQPAANQAISGYVWAANPAYIIWAAPNAGAQTIWANNPAPPANPPQPSQAGDPAGGKS